MRIVAAAADGQMTAGELIFVLAVVAAAVALAAGVGVFRAASVVGPPRVPPGRPLWPLAAFGFVGMLVYWGVIGGYAGHRAEQWRQRQPDTRATWDVSKLAPQDYAVIATLPALAAFTVVLGGDALVRPAVAQRLGLGPAHALPGLWRGVVGILIALPLVYAAMILADQFYRLVDYEHPSEHDLLRVLKETSSPLVRGLIVAGAVVAAPLWEELLFRGHLQTVLRAGLENCSRRFRGNPAERGDASELSAPSPWVPWLAVFFTSLVFAYVHAAWSWPSIFLLSLCLGYAYERTANLWVPMVMHALFNGTVTAIFFAVRMNGEA